MDEPRIALAASPREWAQRLHRHVADHGGARVRATVLHPSDALAEEFDVFVADDTTSFLSKRLVDDLHRRGRAVLGVYDPDDPRGKGDLLDAGVDDVIARDAAPAEFVTVITGLRRRPVDTELDALVRGLRPGGPGVPPDRTGGPGVPPDTSGGTGAMTLGALGGIAVGDATLADLISSDTPQAPESVEDRAGRLQEDATAHLGRGRIAAVSAACGGAGATEVSIALAATCAARGDRCALVDADDVAPALAQRLGLAPYPNLRAAVDVLERRTGSPRDLLNSAPGGFALLPGLSSPRSWTEARPADAVDVLRDLAGGYEHVLANVGHSLEDLHGAGGPPRYGLTRQVLAAADTVVVVALPTPVGLTRLLDWLADLRAVAPERSPHVVFNRAPGTTFKRAEIVDELARTCAPASLWFLPADARVEAAAWAGELVAAGGFTKAVAALADGILPHARGGTPRPRRRWRR